MSGSGRKVLRSSGADTAPLLQSMERLAQAHVSEHLAPPCWCCFEVMEPFGHRGYLEGEVLRRWALEVVG